jgi:hypothetical protein
MPVPITAVRRWPRVLVAGLCAFLLALAPERVHAEQSTTSEQLRAWGAEALDVTNRDMWLDERGLYAERTPRRRRGREREAMQPAFMWSAGVQLTALAAASRTAPDEHRERLFAYIDRMDEYWKTEDGIAGYDVLPAPAVPDRYYDDNAWIVLALVEAYEINGDPALLERAEATMRYVLSGEDEQLGGGIFWREKRCNSKNTCSNAPAVAALLRLYEHGEKDEWLAAARRLHAWTIEHLQDDDDHLMWDNLRLDGRLDRRKFSYNTALVIRSLSLLHKITGEQSWLDEAQRMARAAETHWCDAGTGAVRDSGRFAHMLLEAFLAVHAADGDPRWLATVDRSLRYLHEEIRDPASRYPHSWGRPTEEPLRSVALIDQASAARAFYVGAEAMARQESPPGGDAEPAKATD